MLKTTNLISIPQQATLLAHTNDSPAAIHLSLRKFPIFAFSFAKLDSRDSCAFGFSVIIYEKRVPYIHQFKWVSGSL